MKSLKIGAKIFLGFSCIMAFLLVISITAISSSSRTGSNINDVEVYGGLQNNANELMHILNETRINAGILYETHSAEAYTKVTKQIMYCDVRFNKLNEYINAHPELAVFKEDIDAFGALYIPWRDGLLSMGSSYNLEGELNAQQAEAFGALAKNMYRINLLAHEILSNTITDIDDATNAKIEDMRVFNITALRIAIILSLVALAAAALLNLVIMRSITKPMHYMRDVLGQIGKSGNLRIDDDLQDNLTAVAQGRDETAQCASALLVMMNQLHSIDDTLSQVADGDLTAEITLQSDQDTMGLAVEKMIKDLNQKFVTIAQSTNWVYSKAGELSEGSRLLASGSDTQAASVGRLLESVQQVGQKTEKNTDLARQAADLVNNIQTNASVGTEKMNQMIQAATDINTASQSISKVIKVIDDIAFQTNILALNAAVEAARAGQHGKGFAVVAEEVRNLATKSAEAARETGLLIEDTIQKAALGASIAQTTSQSLEEIVKGVGESNSIIRDITTLSNEQATDIRQIITDVEHVDKIVEQNSAIAAQSATAAGEISDQSNLLKDMVAQFQLTEGRDSTKLIGGARR